MILVIRKIAQHSAQRQNRYETINVNKILTYFRRCVFLLCNFRYSNSTTGYIKWCTFPRILAGENGLVNCDNFKTDYLCPKNSSHLVSRATVCDGSSCGDCLSGYDDGYGTGFKCFKNKSYCGLPQVFLYDNVPDCDDHADICFHDQKYFSFIFNFYLNMDYVYQKKFYYTCFSTD